MGQELYENGPLWHARNVCTDSPVPRKFQERDNTSEDVRGRVMDEEASRKSYEASVHASVRT